MLQEEPVVPLFAVADVVVTSRSSSHSWRDTSTGGDRCGSHRWDLRGSAKVFLSTVLCLTGQFGGLEGFGLGKILLLGFGILWCLG